MLIQGQVQAPPNTSATDGNQYSLMQGKTLELIISELHGKYSTQNYRNNLFMAALTAGTALVAPATNATPNFCLWNPSGNNKAVSLVRVQFVYLSGTIVAGAFGYSYVPNAGSQYGTAAAVSAITTLTVRPCVIGQAYSGAVLAGSAATITGTAPSAAVVARWSPFSQGAPGTASAVNVGINMQEDFDGTMIIPPGVLWYPHASAATTALYHISAVWEEIPWP